MGERRGWLKIFLGYAGGVGKSQRMFDEGARREARGQDVVTADVSGAIDVDAVLRRSPALCLVDGLAFRNPPGSRNAERWQDVEELLNAGISVIATINLQYIREKQARVEEIRGKAVAESVPEAFLFMADDIEIVDATAGRNELAELREMALVLAAEVVDRQLLRYLDDHGIAPGYGTQERILVCITPRSNADLMIGRGRSQADRFHGSLTVAYVRQYGLSRADEAMLQRNLDAARAANARIEMLEGEDAIDAIAAFATSERITQIFIGHTQRTGLWDRFRRSPIERLIAGSNGIDIRIFPQK